MADIPQKSAVGHGNWNRENPRKVAKRAPVGKVSNRAPGRGKSIFSGAEIISQVQNDEYARSWEMIWGGAGKKIPQGDRCCNEKGTCPYWLLAEKRPVSMNGYCSFLEKGDWQLEDSGIWDQQKECNVNKEKEDEGQQTKNKW